MFYQILDQKRQNILPLLKNFKKDFYLAGGTALALYFGHRKSIDFDFFTPKVINTAQLFEKNLELFGKDNVKKIQEEKNTLTIFVQEDIKISFFSYQYSLLEQLKEEKFLFLASVLDIAAMKLAAILSRSTQKDFVDLYFILQKYSLEEILKHTEIKFKDTNNILFLKALTFFDDVEEDPVDFIENKRVDFIKIKNFLIETVKSYNLY